MIILLSGGEFLIDVIYDDLKFDNVQLEASYKILKIAGDVLAFSDIIDHHQRELEVQIIIYLC